MCGIAGFSLTPTSKVKPRQLANAMLTAIEDRGNMASGFAYHFNGEHGYHSAAVPGSSLSLKYLPRKARTVILHTRLATHGSVTDNRNNHPVTSPDNNIALVHNGVIYNHDQVRRHIDAKLPPVDTSVIPAVIEQHGLPSINMLYGDAAIAWLDKRDPDTLHLARYQHSPLVVAHIDDGSFLFASTERLLWRVLIQLDLMPTWMHEPNELDYYTIKHGVINSTSLLPEPTYSDRSYDYSYYRHQTSGAKGGYSGMFFDEWGEYDDYWPEDDEVVLPKEPTMSSTYSNRPSNSSFWTKIYEHATDNQDMLYYDDEEREVWVNELYHLANQQGLTLLDYGSITLDGELVSEQDEALF